MKTYAEIEHLIGNHLIRHELRDNIDALASRIEKEKLPKLKGYFGFPDNTIIDYLVREQGLADFELSEVEKYRYSAEIKDSLEACSPDNPIRSFANPSAMIKAVQLFEEFDREYQVYLDSFEHYDQGEVGLSLEDLEQELKNKQVLFCHRISDRLDRNFWSLPTDLVVSLSRSPSKSRLIGGWTVEASLVQHRRVVAYAEGVLTTAYFDGLSKQDFLDGFSALDEYMASLGEALSHEIERNALPFDSFDHLYGDEDDDVTGCLHLTWIETEPESREQGYARTLLLGIGEAIRNLNDCDVVTLHENGWTLSDPVTYNPVIKSCHKSLVHAVAANYIALTTLSDPISTMVSQHFASGKSCHGAGLSESLEIAKSIKARLTETCQIANKHGRSPLGECWYFYPEWEQSNDHTHPAGEMA